MNKIKLSPRVRHDMIWWSDFLDQIPFSLRKISTLILIATAYIQLSIYLILYTT